MNSRNAAALAWAHIRNALLAADIASDQKLANDIGKFMVQSPYLREAARRRRQRTASVQRPVIERAPQPAMTKRRRDPEIER